MDDPSSHAGIIQGDYRLEVLIEEKPATRTWLAEQVSIHRPVVLVELKEDFLPERESFLADVRAQAAVDLPLMGSVYEAVSTEDRCFVAMERLPGSTLADRLAAREGLRPGVMAHVLAKIAEVILKLEANGTHTSPLGLAAIHLDPHGIVRLANIARAGIRPPERSAEDAAALGTALQKILADGLPGTSRMATLLAWMRGEGLERPLGWEEIRGYANQIEQQLTEGAAPVAAGPAKTKKSSRKALRTAGGAVGLTLVAIAVIFALKGGKDGPEIKLPEPVSISAGTHPTPDGGEEALAAFEIGSHEVTIREYREFLDALKRLPEHLRTNYDADNEPADKGGHVPADWEAMLEAAKTGGTWQGKKMSLECPVVNVDWWDASAFCRWRTNCRLPSQEEWYAALRTGLRDPGKLTPAGWGPVLDIPAGDQTPAGLLGMAGSVAEWTQNAAINPANPLGAKSHVIAGASFLRPGGGALAREWTDDLKLRRPDLGFRVIVQDR